MEKETVQQLARRAAELKARLAAVGDMRPGSLVKRFRRCGKANCWCAQPGCAGHGPSWSLTHAVSGRTVTRIIPQDAVKATTEQIAAHRQFRDDVRVLVEISEKLCDGRLRASTTAAEEAAKKRLPKSSGGGSRRRDRIARRGAGRARGFRGHRAGRTPGGIAGGGTGHRTALQR